MPTIQLKRIYEKPDDNDGIRILIDRLWPRGISKKEAKLDFWLKELAPSNELRKSFNHDDTKFEWFKEKYTEELASGEQHAALEKLQRIIKDSKQPITLLYAAKNKEANNAQVIMQMIQ